MKQDVKCKSLSCHIFGLVGASLLLISCGSSEEAKAEVSIESNPPVVTVPIVVEEKEDTTFATEVDTARFLGQATFGANYQQIQELKGKQASVWFKEQVEKSPSLVLPIVADFAPNDIENDEFDDLYIESTTFAFWRNSISAEDQLRQRVAFALSEILVVSNGGGETLTDVPEAVASYQDILISNAFGNYRDVLEAVTYSPAMGYYLTYMGSEKGDEATGRMPDENYARELLQLFTIGVVELNLDGSIKTDDSNKPLETYSNADITGLARVFTGLNVNEIQNEISAGAAFSTPMQTFSGSHSLKEKVFLGHTIAAGTDAKTSITSALDHIFAHPNLAPFIGKQLIQRLVTSNPTPDYISYVSNAFNEGQYTLPDGTSVGSQKRGDLQATFAAILFHPEAREGNTKNGGKIREPILRFTHWARAFNAQNITPKYQGLLWDTSGSSTLAQHPYRSSSVFNYFRPGYKAPGSLSGEQSLVAPELQITNASSIPGYVNFLTYYVTGEQQDVDIEELQQAYDEEGINLSAQEAAQSFLVTYEDEIDLVDEPQQLLNRLNLVLTYGHLSSETEKEILKVLTTMADEFELSPKEQVQLAILMTMTSPDYLVQK